MNAGIIIELNMPAQKKTFKEMKSTIYIHIYILNIIRYLLNTPHVQNSLVGFGMWKSNSK